jgi:hypothetical protein
VLVEQKEPEAARRLAVLKLSKVGLRSLASAHPETKGALADISGIFRP